MKLDVTAERGEYMFINKWETSRRRKEWQAKL